MARRTLLASCTAHALHDGYADLIYVLLPIWRTELALGFAMLAALRGLYSGAMALFQVPASHLAERFGGRRVLVLGTLVAALGYFVAGTSSSVFVLCAALTLSGAGASVQHPIGSSAVSRAYAAGGARSALGTYNFSGDLGKAAIPALLSLLLGVVVWRTALCWTALLGVIVAGVVAVLMPKGIRPPAATTKSTHSTLPPKRGAFSLLLSIGILDSAVRAGLLTFLPFLLTSKGATVQTIGLALALVFIGGAAGKFACGWLGQRVGVLWTVVLTEGGTAAAILAVLFLPLAPTLAILPLLGVMLNGTSSVLYGTVPELVPDHRAERAFALFYTGTIGSAAIAPVLFGVLGDGVGARWATVATAITALATLPLVSGLSFALREREELAGDARGPTAAEDPRELLADARLGDGDHAQ